MEELGKLLGKNLTSFEYGSDEYYRGYERDGYYAVSGVIDFVSEFMLAKHHDESVKEIWSGVTLSLYIDYLESYDEIKPDSYFSLSLWTQD